jgi:hypothetical protein
MNSLLMQPNFIFFKPLQDTTENINNIRGKLYGKVRDLDNRLPHRMSVPLTSFYYFRRDPSWISGSRPLWLFLRRAAITSRSRPARQVKRHNWNTSHLKIVFSKIFVFISIISSTLYEWPLCYPHRFTLLIKE